MFMTRKIYACLQHYNVLITRQKGNCILCYSTVYTKIYYFEKRRPF